MVLHSILYWITCGTREGLLEIMCHFIAVVVSDFQFSREKVRVTTKKGSAPPSIFYTLFLLILDETMITFNFKYNSLKVTFK